MRLMGCPRSCEARSRGLHEREHPRIGQRFELPGTVRARPRSAPSPRRPLRVVMTRPRRVRRPLRGSNSRTRRRGDGAKGLRAATAARQLRSLWKAEPSRRSAKRNFAPVVERPPAERLDRRRAGPGPRRDRPASGLGIPPLRFARSPKSPRGKAASGCPPSRPRRPKADRRRGPGDRLALLAAAPCGSAPTFRTAGPRRPPRPRRERGGRGCGRRGASERAERDEKLPRLRLESGAGLPLRHPRSPAQDRGHQLAASRGKRPSPRRRLR